MIFDNPSNADILWMLQHGLSVAEIAFACSISESVASLWVEIVVAEAV